MQLPVFVHKTYLSACHVAQIFPITAAEKNFAPRHFPEFSPLPSPSQQLLERNTISLISSYKPPHANFRWKTAFKIDFKCIDECQNQLQSPKLQSPLLQNSQKLWPNYPVKAIKVE